MRVPSGATHQFTLRANSAALTATADESATAKLLGDAAYPIASTTANGPKNTFTRRDINGDGNDHFIWTDFLAEATTTATTALTNDWANGFRLAEFNGGDLDSSTVKE